MLGGNEFHLRRGFACGKTLVRRTRAAAQKGRLSVFLQRFRQSKISILTVPTITKGHASDVLLLWVSPPEGRLHPSGFQCSGRRSHPCAKVLAYGQNACAAHSRRGPEGPFSSSSAAVPPIQNIDVNRPFHKRNLLLIEFKSRFLSVLR